MYAFLVPSACLSSDQLEGAFFTFYGYIKFNRSQNYDAMKKIT